MPATRLEAAGHVVGLGLDLLHAHTIGARLSAHSTKPLSAAERMPFRLSVTSRNAKGSLHDHAHHPRCRRPAGAGIRAVRREAGVLRFGEFKTKAGRLSPYFFNAGLFDDGAKLGRWRNSMHAACWPAGLQFDMLFGPAYKGITLAAAVAVELARLGRNVPFAYNRKEAKDHGEGGTLVGAPVRGRVLIIDDVISAGTSVRESIALIQAAGATPCGVAIALDRQEKASEGGVDTPWSAVQYVREQLKLDVASIATLEDLLQYLQHSGAAELAQHLPRVQAYRDTYGV
jgi:orotate phosphoribosyltransferase